MSQALTWYRPAGTRLTHVDTNIPCTSAARTRVGFTIGCPVAASVGPAVST